MYLVFTGMPDELPWTPQALYCCAREACFKIQDYFVISSEKLQRG